MARKPAPDEDLLLEDDDITAAFLGGDDQDSKEGSQSGDWMDDETVENPMGQLALDVYETNDKLVVQAPIAGIDKNDLDVSISENTFSIKGTRKSGSEKENVNYYTQECYWGQFERSITLPVQVKEDEIDAVLKDGVLTVTFTKVEQNTVKKIEIK